MVNTRLAMYNILSYTSGKKMMIEVKNLNTILEHIIFKIFLGGMPPDPLD